MDANSPITAAAPLPGTLASQDDSLRGTWAFWHSRTALSAVLVALACYAGAKLGMAFTFHPSPISNLWPPNALLLSGLLLTPLRTWWILLLAVLPAHLAAELPEGVPLPMAMAWYASNCTEALIGAVGVALLLRSPQRFDSPRHSGAFLLLCAGLAPLLDRHSIAAATDGGKVRKWGSIFVSTFVEPQWTTTHNGDGWPKFANFGGLSCTFAK